MITFNRSSLDQIPSGPLPVPPSLAPVMLRALPIHPESGKPYVPAPTPVPDYPSVLPAPMPVRLPTGAETPLPDPGRFYRSFRSDPVVSGTAIMGRTSRSLRQPQAAFSGAVRVLHLRTREPLPGMVVRMGGPSIPIEQGPMMRTDANGIAEFSDIDISGFGGPAAFRVFTPVGVFLGTFDATPNATTTVEVPGPTVAPPAAPPVAPPTPPKEKAEFPTGWVIGIGAGAVLLLFLAMKPK